MHTKKVCRKFASLAMAVTLGVTSVIPAYATEGVEEDIAISQESAESDISVTHEAAEPTESGNAGAETAEENTAQENGGQETATAPIDGYFVFIPETQEATFTFDEGRSFTEELDGYTVLMYDAGEAVSVGVEVLEGYAVTAYDWNVSMVGSSSGEPLSFQMPESDVILVVETQEEAGEGGGALMEAIASMGGQEDQPQEEPAKETQATEEAAAETEAATETATEAATEAVTEADTEAVTEAATEAAEETAAETQEETATEAFTEPETEAATEPETEVSAILEEVEAETTVSLEAGTEEVSIYPEKGSVEEAGSFQLWDKDTGFDYRNFRIYEDSNIKQAYKEGEINFEEAGTYRVTYTFSLADDPTYTWEGIVEYIVDPEKDLATARSDEFDNIVGMEIKQSGEFDGVIPETMDGILEGPHYSVKIGNTEFDLEKLNLDYHPDEFNVILKDKGGFDVNKAGDYHVQYNVSSKFYAEYEWVVESIISVVEPKAEGVNVFVKSQSIEVTAFDADGNVLGSARDGQMIDCNDVKSITVASIMDKKIQPKLELAENGNASDAMGWFHETEEGEKSCSYSLNLMDGNYEIIVTDEIYEEELSKKAKTSSGWLNSELADMIVSVDGTKATLSNGTVIDISQPDEEIYGGIMNDDMELEDTVELNADKKVVSKSFAVGKFTGTTSCTNHGWVSNFTGWTKGKVVPTQAGFDKIEQWLLDSKAPVSLDGKKPSDLTVKVTCSNPNGSKMGLPSKTRSGVNMKCTVYKTSKGVYYLKITCSLSKASDSQGNYQTLYGSKKLTLPEEPAPVKITKKFANPDLVSYNPRLFMNTVFTIYDAPECGEDDIVEVLEFNSATATSLTQEFEAEVGETYYMKETGRVGGCRKNETRYTLKPNNTDPSSLSITVTNYDFEYNGLLLKKLDSSTNQPLANAVFKMEYYTRNPDTQNAYGDYKHLGTFYMKTDANGEIWFDAAHYVSSFNGQASSAMPCNAAGTPALTVGWVTFEEVQAPEGFLLDSTRTAPIELKEPDDKTAQTLAYNAPELKNKPDTFKLILHKVSTENEDGNTHYSLAGATYELHSSDIFNESDYVATLTIGANGYSNIVEGLSIDTTYYLKEMVAPPNYELDPNMYPITGASMETKTIELKDSPVKNGEIHLEKYVEEGTAGEGLSKKPGAGIGFTLTMSEDPNYLKTHVTNEEGKLDITGLKYGTYTIAEVASVDDYHILSEPVTFTLDENNPRKDLTKDNGIVNSPVRPLGLRIEKRDKETGELIKGRTAKFQILDAKGIPVKLLMKGGIEKTDVFPMDENGVIRFDSNSGIFGGKYTLVEIECPKGYQKAPSVDFEITADKESEVVTVTMKDEAIKGSLSVTKIDKNTGLNCGSGYQFKVVSADDKTDPSGNVYKGFEKDAVCATITTDENGIASTGDILYTGKYYVQEVQVGDGHAINKTKYPFEIKSDGKTPEDAVNVKLDITNESTSLKIVKVDELHQEKTIEGITFRIKPEGTDDADDQLYVTDENGEIFVTGLKHSVIYTVQEVKTVPGYNLDTCIHKFAVGGDGLVYDIEEDGNDCTVSRKIVSEDWGDDVDAETDPVKGFRYEYVLSNRPNRLQVAKKDATNGKEIAGAQMKLTKISSDGKEENSEVVEEWTSDGKPHYIEGLPAGKYRLTEVIAPDLYEVAESIEFVLSDSMEIQKQEMKDAPYREVEISKTDITDGKELEGATLQVLDAENKVVNEWVSGSDGKAGDGTVLPHKVKLPSGVYTLKETVPAKGFVTASSIVFEVLPRINDGDMEVQKVHMEDDITVLVVSKKDITNSEELPGAHLVIKDKDGNVVEEWISEETPHEIKKIPIGEYTLTEITAPDGYEVAETISFVVTDTKEIQHVEMFDSPFREVTVSKKDLAGSAEIEGAELQITDTEGNVVEEWISGSDGTDEEGNIVPHTVKLHSGSYTLTETKPADGFVTAESIDFTVSQTSATDFEVQSVQMFDDVTKVEISKQDVTTEKELPGAHLEIKNSDGEVVEEWVSTDEPHYIEMLAIGDYVLTETTAPDGYEVSESVKFTIKDTPEIQHVVMYDAPTPEKVETPQTGDGFPVKTATAVAGGIIVLLGAGFLLIRKKKK